MGAARSIPVTMPVTPALCAAGMVTAPLPQPTSSTRMPGPTPAWLTRWLPISVKNPPPLVP
jgi:hypothetical protein